MSKKKSGKTEFIKWFGPVLDALRDLGGSAKPGEITKWIAEHLSIPDEVLNERYEKSGVLKFQNRIAWARQYLIGRNYLNLQSMVFGHLPIKACREGSMKNKLMRFF